jgi:hypothetical protein
VLQTEWQVVDGDGAALCVALLHCSLQAEQKAKAARLNKHDPCLTKQGMYYI